MERLKKKLRKNGYNYTQLYRGRRACIYEQHYTENVKYYEVFIITVRKERTIANKTFPTAEVFPNDEAFGYWAWTFKSLEKAKMRFYELENVNKIKEDK